jgi:hypothetical protein
MAANPVPKDFPRSVTLGAVPGAQPKLLVRESGGRFVGEGATDLEVQGRYEVCEDLVKQLLRYTVRKHVERPEWTPTQLREKVSAAVRRKAIGWDLSEAETNWILRRLIAEDAGPPTW